MSEKIEQKAVTKIRLDASELCVLARGKTLESCGAEIELDLEPLEADELEKAIEMLKVRLTELEESFDSDTGDEEEDQDLDLDSDLDDEEEIENDA